MKKKFFLFDIDGTLINTGGAGKKALLDAFKKYLGSIHIDEDYSFAGKTDTEIIKNAVFRGKINAGEISNIIEKIKKEYYANLEENLIESKNFYVYEGVKDILDYFAQNEEYEIALLTGNLEKGAELKLEHGKIFEYFSWGVFGDFSENRNDLAREAYRIILHKNPNIHPQDIVIIGDTPSDIICAKTINAYSAVFSGGFSSLDELIKHKPDLIFDEFKELRKL